MASSEISAPVTRGRAQAGRGLLTPEPTPGPDDIGREAKKTSEPKTPALKQLAPITEDDKQESGSPKPMNDDNAVQSDSSEDSSEEQLDTGAEQRDAVNHVLSCKRSEYRKMLGVEGEDADTPADQENVLNHFRKQGCLVHPNYNKAPQAKEAFKRILRAAKELHLSPDDINEVKTWDGDEELPPLRLASDGHWAVATDGMEGVEKSDEPQPSAVHQEIWRQATPLLGQLVAQPKDETVIAQIEQLNQKIVDENHKGGLANDAAFTIDVGSFSAIFTSARPYLERLRKSHADSEAKKHFETLNAQLVNFNKHHQYPAEWVMNMPEEGDTNDMPGAPAKPSYRRCQGKVGYVLDDGTHKKIEGAMRAGYGHHLLLSHPGQNGLNIHELVAASVGGRGFGRSYVERSDAVMIKLGALEDLADQQLSDMVINGVASVRRQAQNKPARGWMREAKTICSVSFEENPTHFVWYARSTLGRRFGQKRIDEEMNAFRAEAGQDTVLTSETTSTSATSSGVVEPDAEDSDDLCTTKHLVQELQRLQKQLAQLQSHSKRR